MIGALFNDFEKLPAPQIEPQMLVINLLVGLALSFVLRWHFVKFGKTTGTRTDFARNFTLIILTIIVMISLIKNSVAISLGLVGALSLVRFRTPIKDPEELVYLLLAVVIGTGLGAGATVGTVSATLLILFLTGVASMFGRRQAEVRPGGMHMSITHVGENLPTIAQVFDLVSQVSSVTHLQRFDVSEGRIDLIFFVQTNEANRFTELTEKLTEAFPSISVSAVESQMFEHGS
jgi:hypothetical protein